MSPSDDAEVFRRRFPNLAARQEMDRQEHIRRAREMGATRKQASRHANEEVGMPGEQ